MQHLAQVDNRNYTLDEYTHPDVDSAVLLKIEPYRLQMERIMGEKIGHADSRLYKAHPDGPLNRWFADVIHDEAEIRSDRPVDFVVQNYYGLRVEEIPKGEITLGMIYQLMPFENYLVMQDIPGTVVLELCNLIAGNDGWPVSRGISFEIVGGRADNIRIGDRPLDLEKSYRLATNDYLANGGDQCEFLRDFEQINTGVLVRDLIIDHIRGLTEDGENVRELDAEPRIVKP